MGIPKLLTFFNPIENFWPRALPLADVHLVATRFEHRPLSEDEFSSYGVPLPATLHSAAHKRRAEFLAGRLCAQHALRMLNGQGCVPGIRQDRAPQWPRSSVGSITHSNIWAAALVASAEHYMGLGLDIEPCLSNSDGRKLAQGILTTGEWSRCAQHPAEQFGLILTLTFSLKESLFKALYPLTGTRFYFEHAELVDWDLTRGVARLRLLKNLDHKWLAGRELDAYFCQVEQHIISIVAVPHP